MDKRKPSLVNVHNVNMLGMWCPASEREAIMRYVLQGFPLHCRYIPDLPPGIERLLRESKSG